MEYLKKGMIRPAQEEEERSRQVSEIIHNIRKSGDEAILEYNTRFDGNSRREFRVAQQEIDEAYEKMSEQELEDLRQAAGNIRAFAEAQRDCLKNLQFQIPVWDIASYPFPHAAAMYREAPILCFPQRLCSLSLQKLPVSGG